MNQETAPTRNHWEEIEGHPVEDWRYEVKNDDTRLGYLEWVDHRVEADPDKYCRTCATAYDGCGDGYDGECPSCADKTHAKECPDEDDRYYLALSRKQMEVVNAACELFTRMRMGQIMICLNDHAPWRPYSETGSDRHAALRALCGALQDHLAHYVNGVTSSYGISSKDLDPRAKVACDIHEVIRHNLAWEDFQKEGKPPHSVSFDRPMHWGTEPLAEIHKRSQL